MTGWLAAALAALAAAPLVAELMRRAGPAGAPEGEIVRLPSGATHVRRFGGGDGPVAVGIHGLTTPSYALVPLATRLAAAGWRVVLYDLHGRGHSALPDEPQTAAHFDRQLAALLEAEGLDDAVKLIGFSMGGRIAAGFAARNPARVRSVVLLAAAGLAPPELGLLSRLSAVPVLGWWLMLVFGGRTLRRQIARAAERAPDIPDIAARQAAETRRRGYLPAVRSSQRHVLGDLLEDAHARLRDHFVPVLAVWGGKDAVIPAASGAALARINPDARQLTVEGAGHGLPYTHPDKVAAAILDFAAGAP